MLVKHAHPVSLNPILVLGPDSAESIDVKRPTEAPAGLNLWDLKVQKMIITVKNR